MAIVALSFIALALPIVKTHASVEGQAAPTQQGNLAEGLRQQAETLAHVLGTANSSRGGAQITFPQLQSVPGIRFLPKSALNTATVLAARTALASPNAMNGSVLRFQAPVSFSLHEDGISSTNVSSRPTVGEALASMGIKIGPGDTVSPSTKAPLTVGLHVYVRHAKKIELIVGGKLETKYTQASTVADLLKDAGVELGPLDKIAPDLNARLGDGQKVEIVLVRETVEPADEGLPYATEYRSDPGMLQGRQTLARAGVDGVIHREFLIRRENGVETARALLNETRTDPVNEVIVRGAAPIYIAPAGSASQDSASPGSCVRTLNVYATWYTAASSGGVGITRTGTPVAKGIVAVDPRVIPLGTRMYIPGYGYGVAGDTGGGIVGNMIDLGYGPGDYPNWRTGPATVCILG